MESVLSSHVKSELPGTYFASLTPKELTTQARNICGDLKGGASIAGELARKILQYHPATANQVGDFMGLSIGTHCPQFIAEAQRAAS